MREVILKLLKKCDILATNMPLNMNGGRTIRTWFGVFLTLVWIGLALYATIEQILMFQDKSHPFVAVESKVNSVYPSIDVVKNKHLPIFFALAGTALPLTTEELKSYFTVKFRQVIYTIAPNGIEFEYKVNYMPSISCQALIDNGMLQLSDFGNLQAFANVVPTHGMCADTRGISNLTVAGSFSDNYEQFIGVELYPCSLPDTTQCKSKEEISYTLIQILKPAVDMDLGNKENPIKYKFNGDMAYYMNPDIFQVVNQPLIINEIVDSEGFLIPDVIAAEYTTYAEPTFGSAWRSGDVVTTEADIEAFLVNPYFRYEVISSGKYNKITRTYNSFLDYLGNIGGIYSILFGAFGTFYHFYHYRAQKEQIVHAIYGLKAKNKGCRCKRKKSQSKNLVGPFNHSDFMRELRIKSEENKEGNPEKAVDKSEAGTIYVSSQIIDKAFDAIKCNLDMVSICREMNILKCLTSVLLRDYHSDLVPLVSLSKYLEETQNQLRKKKKGHNSCYNYLSKKASYLQLDHHELNFREGMETLVKNMELLENQQNESIIRSSVISPTFSQLKNSPSSTQLNFDIEKHDVGVNFDSIKAIEKSMTNQFYEALANISTLLELQKAVPESPNSKKSFTFIDKISPSKNSAFQLNNKIDEKPEVLQKKISIHPKRPQLKKLKTRKPNSTTFNL